MLVSSRPWGSSMSASASHAMPGGCRCVGQVLARLRAHASRAAAEPVPRRLRRASPRPRRRSRRARGSATTTPSWPGMYRHRMEKASQSDYAVLFWLRGILDARLVRVRLRRPRRRQLPRLAPLPRLPAGHCAGWSTTCPAIIEGRRGAGAPSATATGLAFTSDVADGRGCDVFLAAGALQYVDDRCRRSSTRMGSRPHHLIAQQDAALRRRDLRDRAVDRPRVPPVPHLQPRRVGGRA